MVDAMKDLCQNVNSNCSETGLQAQLLDSLHVAPVPLLPRESNLVDPKCDRATSLADSLCKILKMCGPSDSLKMRWQSDADTICFQCESGAGGSVKDGSAKRMIKEAEKAPTMVDAMKDLRKDVNLDCSEMSMQARRLSEIENQNHAPREEPWHAGGLLDVRRRELGRRRGSRRGPQDLGRCGIRGAPGLAE